MSAKTQSPESRTGTAGSIAKAAFWLAGSAFFGSLALVLWNRRALKSLREAEERLIEPPRPRDDHGIY
jgi:hypothetical protein